MRPARILSIVLAALCFPHVLSSVEQKPENLAQVKIAVLISSDTGIYADALAGFRSALPQVEIKTDYLDAFEDDPQRISRFLADTSYSPFLLTIGSRATRVALAEAPDRQIIFSMVNAPRAIGVSANSKACGVSMDVSLVEYFRYLKKISPNAKTVYAFYSTPEGEFSAGEGDYYDLREGLEFIRVKLSGRDELGRALEQIKGKADAFYLVPDALYDSEKFQQLSDFCKKNKIILMTGFTSLMQAGATFSIRPDYGRLGSMTGDMARTYLTTGKCGDARTKFPDQSFFSLNEEYAAESQIKIPEEIRQEASTTRLFLAGVNLMNADKLKSARAVFEAILARNPGNKTAQEYREKIISRQAQDQTTPLLRSADRDLDAKNYDRAVAEYGDVLRIDPGNQRAKDGRQRALSARSEQSRLRGDAAAQRDPYEAAKYYTEALRFSESNREAAQGLESIKIRQRPQLPTYLKEGIGFYDDRKYDQAIVIFGNILLVDPANREAQEYLRISVKRRDALNKLINK